MLIKEGDKIEKGQTVALLDSEGAENVMTDLEDEMEAQRLLRDCYLRVSTENPEITANSVTRFGSSYMSKISERHCEEAKSEFRKMTRVYQEKKALIEQRLKYSNDQKALLLSMARDQSRATEELEAIASRVIEIGLKTVSYEEAISALRIDHEENLGRYRLEKMSRVSELTETIRRLQYHITIMQKIIVAPRLYAPKDGVAASVRFFRPETKPVDEEITVFQIDSNKPKTFNASFVLKESDARKNLVGSEVQMTPLGVSPGRLPLRGKVIGYAPIPDQDIEQNSDPMVRAIVDLSPDSSARLKEKSSGIALHDTKTATSLVVQQSPTPLGEILISRTIHKEKYQPLLEIGQSIGSISGLF
ncbi:MAG: hypothetical protein ABJO27_24345 [Pseudoruegeria sp.]